MKKTVIALLIALSSLALQSWSHAQEIEKGQVGLWPIIFEEQTQPEQTHALFINDISYTLITLHLIIADKDIELLDYQGETLATIKTLEELTKTDVIQLLNISADKQKALSDYLTQCDQTLKKWDSISTYMKQEAEILKLDIESCIKDKNVTDKAYFDAIERYDQDNMEISLNQSIASETCASQKKVEYNANIGIARKLVFYLGVLQKKYNLLAEKQEILAKNYQIFRDGILPDLIQIDELLQQYKF